MKVNIAELDAILFTFFWTDIGSIKRHLEQGNRGAFTDNTDIAPMLNLEYAYKPNPLRATFFEAGQNACIMFPNLQYGWQSLVGRIKQAMQIKSCYIRIMDDKKMLMPSNCLCYSEGRSKRTVYAQKEKRWVFADAGTPLFFETPQYYESKQIKARLNKKILLEYCERLGVSKSGAIDLCQDSAFSYEAYWEGKFADCKGRGPTSLRRKALKED